MSRQQVSQLLSLCLVDRHTTSWLACLAINRVGDAHEGPQHYGAQAPQHFGAQAGVKASNQQPGQIKLQQQSKAST